MQRPSLASLTRSLCSLGLTKGLTKGLNTGLITALIAGFTAGLASGHAMAETPYPNRPIRLIVPYSAGSSPDAVARIVSKAMAPRLGQAIVVENRPGADGIIGSEYVAKQARPDGYTVLAGIVSNFAILPLTYKNLRFDPLHDLPAVIGLAQGRYVFLSSVKEPWQNFEQFAAYAKAHPGQLNYGSPTPQVHLSTEALLHAAGLDVRYIPYAASGAYSTALLSGEVQMGFISTSSALSFADKVHVLTITGAKRQPPFLSVPTLTELHLHDLPGLDFTFNVAAGTPRAIVDRLYQSASEALRQPDVQKQLNTLGFDVTNESPQASAARLADEAKLFATVARQAGVEPQ